MKTRYAEQSWICSTCAGHCVTLDRGVIRCERCGFDYVATGMSGEAKFVPDPEFDEDYIAEHGE